MQLVVPMAGLGQRFADVGYTPVDIAKPPQCSDGIDNNGNGVIDFPAEIA